MKKSMFVAVLLTLAVLLTACGGGDAIVGKWESVYMSEGEMNVKAVGVIKMEIKGDNTFVGDSNGEKGEGTWKKDGDKYILTSEGSDVEATIEKGLLAVNFMGTTKMYLSKDAKNFKDYPEGTVDFDAEKQ